jgi:peptidyl-prolyl cis-trans isomerase SurA
MNWKKSWVAAALAAAALGVQPAAAQMAEAVAAIVNDNVISTFDVRQRANLILLSAGVRPTPEIQQRARGQALRDLVDERLQLQEAKKYDITISGDNIDQRIRQIAQANQTTPDAFMQNLSGAGVGAATLRQQIEADLAWQRLMAGMFRSRIRISSVEVRETQARIAANSSRPQFLVSEIFLPAESDAERTEAQASAQRLLEQMQHGAPFPLVARQFSAAPSAAAGGDLGWLALTELPSELQSVVERLQPGQVSVPVRGQHGVFILALRDRREGIAAGSATMVALRQITAPESSRNQMERAQRRVTTCSNLDNTFSNVPQVQISDLGEPSESDLSDAIRGRIANVTAPGASPVAAADGQVSTIVVCSRTVGGGGVPSADDIENRLFDQELSRQSERYLRNLRREATIITR